MSNGAHSLPLGNSLPANDKHAVSVSLPTWDNIVRYMQQDRNIHEKLQSDYPRFYQHADVEILNKVVLQRLQAAPAYKCAIFPSLNGARRCEQYLLTKATACDERLAPTRSISFFLSKNEIGNDEVARWAQFTAVLYDQKLAESIVEFWGWFGDGISSRHAIFCSERFNLMEILTTPQNELLPSPPPSPPASEMLCTSQKQVATTPWPPPASESANEIRKLIAKWAQPIAEIDDLLDWQKDVCLFPKGMCAISAVARALVPSANTGASEAVVFGWPYGSTPKCVNLSGYERFTFYSQGTSKELDVLEAKLQSGSRIACLFCEVPSNPLCAIPDLYRIRNLADVYDFVVVCDETIGTFVNVDVLLLVDVLITSLTKLFSGACNVMGGSVVLNPRSKHYSHLRSTLDEMHEDLMFPKDAAVLLQNCLSFPERVQIANRNALAIVDFLQKQPADLITRVNYPTTVASRHLYERYRRKPSGGYGSLISVIFKDPAQARTFYNAIDLCKGPSFGANFTLVLPYSQLAHAFELDWAESLGMPKHIIRISVGLEDKDLLTRRLHDALRAAEVAQ
ncbi:hypothetical protein CKM354_000005900 [Cercospora kikuchii]|uniref:Cystathionine gamma-synthase n=1 Tax=Cercospora kikuchii TaxID=84275 RepID=A0A9P3C538_9PEZI|nr:uncharacterized protein CKM354_000005900 [Cercospora kikuchii]GIZ36589.1 hypothetical protein CKM354_000005900 [Cercospora kikuchii]